jgi:sugar phosphate isomerase/epimerase
MKLACQEQLIPGETILDKWKLVRDIGFEAIELLGRSNFALEKRLPELKAAQAEGAVFSSVCVAMPNFIGDADPEQRRDAVDNVKSQLSVIAELGGVGVVSPTSFGKATNALPPWKGPLTKDEQRQVMVDVSREIGEHAQSVGAVLLLEPLNRYETNFMHKLADGAAICREIGLPSVKIMADLYHMNIEESDPNQAMIDTADVLAHIHICDSNRGEPGVAHIDFRAAMTALTSINYTGYLSLECGLRAEPEQALRNTVSVMRAAMA